MNDNTENSGNVEKKSSRKNLLRILVILGIGIPLLLELFTLFKLFTGEEKHGEIKITEDVKMVTAGDQVIPVTPPVIVLEYARILASPEEFIFEIELELEDIPGKRFVLELEDLKLKSGQTIKTTKRKTWRVSDNSKNEGEFETNWSIPPGDTPEGLKLKTVIYTDKDEKKEMEHNVIFGKIPVMYNPSQTE